jgi:hypothetical protein
MPNADDILWFKREFRKEIEKAVEGTPFDLDMLAALACQETGEIWPLLRKKGLSRQEVLTLCVGDTIDAKGDGGRRAFPRNKSALLAVTDGARMFDIARKALVDMSKHVAAYRTVATNPNKFCHGFGIFQLDLQFFLSDPGYFLERRYEEFSQCLAKCLGELQDALERIGWSDRARLTDLEMACVAIAYNTGRYRPSLGLKQGHFNGTQYYGEAFFDYLRLARTVAVPGAPAVITPPQPGSAAVPPPSPITATGPIYRVETLATTLRVRSEPLVSSPDPTTNVVGELPDGHLVRAVTGKAVHGFLEVETNLGGAGIRGFASTKYLVPQAGGVAIAMTVPASTPPTTGIVAVHMPRKAGTITRRSQNANAHSLNEAGQPGRGGTSPEQLRAELAAIVAWLDVEKPSHARYQPRDKSTFCNIYAHDYCHLAGVYLPRVWWTFKAIEALATGKKVTPLYADTITELRANDLFRWLRDFGPRFGWRQTGTATKLQQEANQGAIGLVVARRKDEGRPGHITVVVPETADHRARRDSAGEVIGPLQSQAGAVNFRYGNGKSGWWSAEQFAESGFWLHA